MSKKGKEKAQETPSKKRSEVWNFFTRVDLPDGSRKAVCRFCGKHLCGAGTDGTRHLWGHPCVRRIKAARTTLPSYPPENRNNHLGYVQQRNTGEPSGSQENNLEYDPQINLDIFVKMVIDNKRMLEYVENPFLEEFARSLQSSYSHVTRRDVEKACLTFYQIEKAQLKEKITKLNCKVSLSLALCYNSQDKNQQLICVAAHFIDDDFRLVKIIVGLVECLAGEEFDSERILNDWKLGTKAFACTAKHEIIRKSNPPLDVKCILECIHKIANEIYIQIESDKNCIENMMKDLNECPDKMRTFNEIAAEKKLPYKFEFLVNKEGVLGSVLDILNDACTYKDILCEFGPMKVEWIKVEEVVHLLNEVKEVNDAVVKLSSLEFPTSNLLLEFIFKISDLLTKASPVFPGTRQAIHKSLAQLDEYLANCNYIVLIASWFDPRFKFRLLNRYIEKLKASEADFYKFFTSLYDKYKSESPEISRLDCLSPIEQMNKCLERISVKESLAYFDVLGWWKVNESEYPILSRMACDILAIPISSSLTSGTEPVEEIIKDIFNSTVDTGMAKVLVCCNNWLRSACTAGESVAVIENPIERRHLDQAFPVYDHIKCQDLLAKLVISSELPFHFVENTWFIEWAKNLQPSYTPVDLVSIKTKCLGFYLREIGRFKDLHMASISLCSTHLESVCFSVHLAGEFPNKYFCVTAHFIDSYFNLVRRITGIKIITRSSYNLYHPAIKQQVQRWIHSWGFPKKVLACTTQIFCNEYHQRFFDGLTCGAAAIKLDCVVQGLFNGLLSFIWDELGKVFESIRKMIKFLAEDPNTMHNINQLGIKLDDKRRWDSTLKMLSDALANKNVFYAYKDYDESFPFYENWNEVESAVELLKPIYEAVTILSSSQYPTSNLFLKIVFEIYDVLSHVVFHTNNQYDKGKFLDCLMIISDSYLKDCNNILLVASLLDPRFKSKYLERCYTEHISNREEIEKFIGDLCVEFEIEHEGVMSELKKYEQEDHGKFGDDNFDVLRWWKVEKSNSVLSRIACHILAVPVSSLPSELAFSTAFFWRDSKFITFGKFANKVGPKTLEALVCSYNWLSDASNNEQGKYVQKAAAIDGVAKHIPSSYRCPLRVCDIWSLSFLMHGLSERNMSEKIVAIGRARLTAEEMQCLIQSIDNADQPGNWIPNDVINCYISIMNNQGSTSTKIMRLSTFDTQLLKSWSMEEIENLSERIEKGNCFLQNELVFLPIHMQNHWFVGALNTSEKEFQILSSFKLFLEASWQPFSNLRKGIQKCIKAALSTQEVRLEWILEDVYDWPISVISNLPQQKDGCSCCGLFALKYMQVWDGSNLSFKFTQDDVIDLFRKQLVGELIFSDLNEMKDIQHEIKKKKIITQARVTRHPYSF